MRRSQRLSKPQAPISDEHLSDSSLSDLPESDEDSGIGSSNLMTLSDDDDELLSSDHAVSDHSSDDETFSPSRSKKPKKTQRKKKSKAEQVQSNRPAGLVNLPAEVVLIVLAQTDIETMYNLSFVNKHLHDLLAGPVCESTWSEILAADKLPVVDMPGLKLAHLLFAKYCFHCERKCTMKPEGGLRTRVCKLCYYRKINTTGSLNAFYDEEPVHPVVKSVLCYSVCLKSELRRTNDYLFEKFPVPAESLGTWNRARGDWNYSAAPVVSFRKVDQESNNKRVQGPKIQLYHWIEDELEKQRQRMNQGYQLDRWLSDRRKKNQADLVAFEDKRLEDVRAKLEERDWTDEDFEDWNRWNVPNSVFKAAILDDNSFHAILDDLEDWIAPRREERVREKLRLQALEEERQAEHERKLAQERLGQILERLHRQIETTIGDEEAILPFAPFTLLPSVQRLFEDATIDETSKEFGEIEKEATREAIEAARKCDMHLMMEVKTALCDLLSHAPHLDWSDLVKPGPPLDHVSLNELDERVNLEACAICFVTTSTWNEDNGEPGRAHSISTWTLDSLTAGLKQFYSSQLVSRFEHLDVFRKGFGMQTATDWACSDKALVSIQPRHQVISALIIQALKREGVAPNEWSSTIRDCAVSWYCRSCGHVGSVDKHISTDHLYRTSSPRKRNEVDDFTVWKIERVPSLRYLPAPDRLF